MADIYPFRGINYRRDKVGSIERVVSQPYDKITPQMKVNYLHKSPYNIVRVILPAPAEGSPAEEPYLEAAQTFNTWLSRGILEREMKACLYPYNQSFQIPGTEIITTRRGFVGLGKLYDYSEGVIRPHEQTHSGPKLDRLMLTRATGCQFGLIFMLYHDPERAVNSLLAEATLNKKPLITVEDEHGVTHTMWAVEECEKIRAVQREMKDKKLYIADGHHRYETALTYWREQVELGVPVIGDEAIDRVMMVFVSIHDHGLAILPTHRVLFALPDFQGDKLITDLQAHFEIQELGPVKKAVLGEALEKIAGRKNNLLFIAKDKDFIYRLQLRSSADPSRLIAAKGSALWKSLDVNILHKLIFGPFLGISEEDLERREKVAYVRDPAEALDMVFDQTSQYQAAFFLNPSRVEDVVAVADGGECMPQKSTDFYPKMLTGLVINQINRL
ncbi:MAG TPA: DUF1015 domain-containing protein [archaeon]|nr:DUF1015 domain-containing protein [archaeon]